MPSILRRFWVDGNITYNGIYPGSNTVESFVVATDLTIADLNVSEGTNKCMGTATLVGGTVTVSTTKVTANSRIFLTSNTDGGAPGWLRVSARTAATSFTITSSSATDTSSVSWLLVEPA